MTRLSLATLAALWAAHSIYGLDFQLCAEALGLEQVRITPRSPWQSPYVERLIGSVRRDCLDHLIVLNQAHLHRVLENYFTYYHASRTHLGLDRMPRRRGGCNHRKRARSW